MGCPVNCHDPFADVGVAVAATMRAGIIGTDIDTGGAATTRPLPFVLGNPDRLSQNRSHQLIVDTSGCLDSALILEKGVAAGFEVEGVLTGYASQLPDKMYFFSLVQSQEINTAQVAQMLQGLSARNVEAQLEDNLPLASDPEIRLTPSWWPWMPIVPFRISVVTE